MSEDQKTYLDWLNEGRSDADAFPGLSDAVRRLTAGDLGAVCFAHAEHVFPDCPHEAP